MARIKCGWGRSAGLTASQSRTHFTICPKRPAASDDMDRRGGNGRLSGATHWAADAA